MNNTKYFVLADMCKILMYKKQIQIVTNTYIVNQLRRVNVTVPNRKTGKG